MLPVLRGDRLVARVDAKADRQNRVLLVPVLHLEDEAEPSDLKATQTELDKLAAWLGLSQVPIDLVVP